MYVQIYTFFAVGKESCIILDRMVNNKGSEAVANTKLKKCVRTLVKICLSEPSRCSNSITGRAKIYREGNTPDHRKQIDESPSVIKLWPG